MHVLLLLQYKSPILAAVLCNSSIRTATLRAAYDSPGVTRLRRVCSWHHTQCGVARRDVREGVGA